MPTMKSGINQTIAKPSSPVKKMIEFHISKTARLFRSFRSSFTQCVVHAHIK